MNATMYNGGAPILAQEGTDVTGTTSDITTVTGHEVWLLWIFQRDGGSTAPAPTYSNNGSLTKDDVASASNGATDYSCAVVFQRYKITSGAAGINFTWADAAGLGNAYCYAWDVDGQDTSDSRGDTDGGVSGVTNGAFNLTFSPAPATGDIVLQGMTGTLNSGAGNVDPASGYSELIDAARTDWNVREVSTRTSSTSSSAGWSDVSNNGAPVSYYKNPVGVAVIIKAATSGNVSITPNTGTLSTSGNAPSVTRQTLLAGVAGALALVGFAPTVTTVGVIQPPTGSMAITGVAPALTQQITIRPNAGSLGLTGNQAVATSPGQAIPSAGALNLVGLAPDLTLTLPSPDNAVLTLTGYAPQVAVQQAGSPSTGSLALTGIAPVVTQNRNITPTVGSLTFNGQQASLVGQNLITPSTGSLGLTGGTPSRITLSTITPPAGSLSFTGVAPQITTLLSPTIVPRTGSLAFDGQFPTGFGSANTPGTSVGGTGISGAGISGAGISGPGISA